MGTLKNRTDKQSKSQSRIFIRLELIDFKIINKNGLLTYNLNPNIQLKWVKLHFFNGFQYSEIICCIIVIFFTFIIENKIINASTAESLACNYILHNIIHL